MLKRNKHVSSVGCYETAKYMNHSNFNRLLPISCQRPSQFCTSRTILSLCLNFCAHSFCFFCLSSFFCHILLRCLVSFSCYEYHQFSWNINVLSCTHYSVGVTSFFGMKIESLPYIHMDQYGSLVTERAREKKTTYMIRK